MTNDQKPIWTKQLDKFTLLEYPKQSTRFTCCVEYEERAAYFGFSSWGMEPEDITEQDCLLVCESILDGKSNVLINSHRSFNSDLNHVQAINQVSPQPSILQPE